jgi:hypothetical protein
MISMADEKKDPVDASDTPPQSAAPTSAPQSDPEPQILEEIIIKKERPAPKGAPTVPPAPAAAPSVPAALSQPDQKPIPEPLPAAQQPAEISEMPQLVKKSSDAPKKAPIFAPLPPVFKPAPKISSESPTPPPVPNISNDASASAQAAPVSMPTSATPPAAPQTPPVIPPEQKPLPPPPPALPQSEPENRLPPPPAMTAPAAQVPSQNPSAPSGESALNADIAKILEGVKLPERVDNTITQETKPKAPIPQAGNELQDAIVKESGTGNDVPGVVTPRSIEKADVVSPVHTLKDDLQGAVKEQKISLVRAVSLEEDRRHREKPQTPSDNPGRVQRSHRAAGIVFGIFILVLLGAGALFGIYTVENARSAVPAAPAASILFAETSVTFALDNQSPGDIKNVLLQARNSSKATLGSITRIIPTVIATTTDNAQARPATFGEFMTAMGATPPDDLVRALSPDFFFGIHTVDTNAPLFVIPVMSYDHAFAGMLAWETTMDSDLSPLFSTVPATIKDANGLPTQRVFSDLVMRNYDVRALKDDAGNIVLYYSFPTQNLLIIAASPYTFTEVLSRLQAERKL